jgi:hypothetical protein
MGGKTEMGVCTLERPLPFCTITEKEELTKKTFLENVVHPEQLIPKIPATPLTVAVAGTVMAGEFLVVIPSTWSGIPGRGGGL